MQEAKKREGIRSGINFEFNDAIGLVEVSVAFEAFIDELKKVKSIWKKRKNFSSKYQDFFEQKKECVKEEIKALKEELEDYPLEDMAANTALDPIKINDENNLGEIIEVVYRVRSNLVHGSKSLTTPRNRILISNSFHFLYGFMELVFREEEIN